MIITEMKRILFKYFDWNFKLKPTLIRLAIVFIGLQMSCFSMAVAQTAKEKAEQAAKKTQVRNQSAVDTHNNANHSGKGTQKALTKITTDSKNTKQMVRAASNKIDPKAVLNTVTLFASRKHGKGKKASTNHNDVTNSKIKKEPTVATLSKTDTVTKILKDTLIQAVDSTKLFKQRLDSITHHRPQADVESAEVDSLIKNYYNQHLAPPSPNRFYSLFWKFMEIIGIIIFSIILILLIRSLIRQAKQPKQLIAQPTPKQTFRAWLHQAKVVLSRPFQEPDFKKLENLEATLQQTNQQLHLLKAELGVISPQLDRGRYFFAEVMTSAGPRKSEEIGLGEDVAGVIIREDFACFWVLDGVSDNHILKNQAGEYFSSRLLAQYIAWGLHRELLMINHVRFDLKSTLIRAIGSAREGLQEKIDKLSDLEQDFIRQRIQQRDIPTVATTILMGILTKQGHLKVCRVGTDKFIALPAGRFSNPKEETAPMDRIAFSLDVAMDGTLQLAQAEVNPMAIHTEVLTEVRTVIAATDGVSNQLLKWMKAQSQFDFTEPQLRQTIANYSGNTNDDKALCVIQIKDANG